MYGLMYVAGIALAIWITRRRWAAAGCDPALVYDVALWAIPAGIIGGRIHDLHDFRGVGQLADPAISASAWVARRRGPTSCRSVLSWC
jgi:prolipoprotein diacylglyceryltransferase